MVVLEDREVERKMKQESDDMDVLAMGQFLIGRDVGQGLGKTRVENCHLMDVRE